MRIARIHIENFRGFQDFTFAPRPQVNVLIGENNSGKSSLLEALDKALGRGAPSFDLGDFFVTTQTADPRSLQQIRIDLELRPTPEQDFSAAFSTEFVEEIDFEPVTNQPFLTYRTDAIFDPREERVSVEFYTVRADGTSRPMPGRKRFALRSFVPFYRADAFRDALRELRNRRSFWGRLVDSIVLDPGTATAVQDAIRVMNAQVLASTPRLAEVRDRFREVGQVITMPGRVEDVVLNPVPLEPSEILRNLEVLLQTLGAPRGFALDRHGEGTRSVASLVIFRAFIDLLSREENNNSEAEPIIGIEEPEVHLHPHARRAIARLLSDQTRQMFVTTHSGAVAQAMSPLQVTLLRRAGSEIVRSQIPERDPADPARSFLDDREQTILERQLRAGAAEVFFARAVILVEGDSERLSLPVFAKALGLDLDVLGISLASVSGQAYRPILKMLSGQALGVPWVILSDGEEKTLHDLAGFQVDARYVEQTLVDQAQAAGRLREEVLIPRDCFSYDAGRDFEGALIWGGALAEYEAAIIRVIGPTALSTFIAQKSQSAPAFAAEPREEQVHAFLKDGQGKKNKPILARIVAEAVTQEGTDSSRIPQAVADVLRRAHAFAVRNATKS